MVLRTVKYGESGLVVDMLTEKEGRVSFMVKLSKSPMVKRSGGLCLSKGQVSCRWSSCGLAKTERSASQ